MSALASPAATVNRWKSDFADLLQRHRAVEKLLILDLCLIYAAHDIAAARNMFYFAVLPAALLTARWRDARAMVTSPIIVAAAIYFVLIALTSLVGPGADVAAVANHLRHAALVLAFLAIVAHLVRTDPRFPVRLFLFVSPVAALTALINVGVYYGQIVESAGIALTPSGLSDILWGHRLGGIPGLTVYYNANVIAAVYAVAGVGAFASASRLTSRAGSALMTVASVVLLVAVLLTQSRGAILAMLIGCGLVVAFGMPRRARAAAVVIGAGALAALLALTPIVGTLLERADSDRLYVWGRYYELALQRPWLGYGIAAEPMVQAPSGLISNPHNILFSAVVTGGLISAAALLAVLVLSALASIRAMSQFRIIHPLALLFGALAMTSVDYQVLADALGWPTLVLWLPVALCAGADPRLRGPPP